jgi:phosphohistidine phosphatase
MPALVLFRHAKAAQPLPGQQDFSRPLTERGRNDAASMGKILAGLGIDLALVSAACRTRETWEIASREIATPPALSIEQDLYLCSSAKLVTRLRRTPANIEKIVAVGHNPCTQEVALWLARHAPARSQAAIREKFPTAAIAIFDLAKGGWGDLAPERVTLRRFTTPGLIASEAID